jgi:signal transduction histidine kinase
VEAVATELVERYRDLFRAKPVALHLSVKSLPRLKVDRAVLSMVLGNLLRNALSFTDAGEVEVVIEADRVRVEDTGQGIPKTDSNRLFQPYVRSGDSAGAGLGLSLVQRLCERQGWRVSLARRTAGGTEACLWFKPDLTIG